MQNSRFSRLLSFLVVFLFHGGLAHALAPAEVADQSRSGERCTSDLQVLPDYLEKNDAGVRDWVEKNGKSRWSQSIADFAAQAERVGQRTDCDRLLREFLSLYRKGHLGIQPEQITESGNEAAAPAPPNLPSLRKLSRRTTLLTIPSFDSSFTPYVEKLVTRLKRTPPENLIIDIRGNGGGSDWTWKPVVPLLQKNRLREFGMEFLATKANVRASEYLRDRFLSQDRNAIEFLNAVIAASKAASSGTYVRLNDGMSARYREIQETASESLPRSVALLIDDQCASSCEEFVLAAKQSWKVKVFGRPTAGMLDYSNLRPWPLPSGERILWYATSRSARLPEFGIDGSGIQPDHLLPLSTEPEGRTAEVAAVRKTLESIR